MLPLLLEFEGLHSYQQRTIIDFKKLTDAGLFGIFGATGSGKSTILEAMILALYGHSERMDMAKMDVDIVNLKTKKLSISFTFTHAARTYRFNLSQDLTGKNPVKNHTAQVLTEGLWQGLSDKISETPKVAEGILGSKENFKRTTIIPQGKFSEFLRLRGTDLSKMMEELFDLSGLDIDDKIKAQAHQNDQAKSHLEGQLAQLKQVSAEELKEWRYTIDALSRTIAQEKKALDDAKAELEILKQQQQKQHEFEIAKEELSALLLAEPEWKQKYAEAQQYQRAYDALKPHIDAEKELETKIQQLQTQVSEKETLVVTLREAKEKLTAEQAQLEAERQLLPIRTAEVKDARTAAEWLTTTAAEQALSAEVGSYKTRLLKLKDQEKEVQHSLNTNKELVAQLQAEQLALSQLAPLKSWYQTRQNLEDQRAAKTTQWAQIDASVQHLGQEIVALCQHEALNRWQAGPQDLHNPEKWAQWVQELENEKLETEEAINNEKDKQGLLKYRHLLHAGEACPLCGGTDHDNHEIIETREYDQNLELLTAKRAWLIKSAKLLTDCQLTFTKLKGQQDAERAQFKVCKEELAKIGLAIEEHLSSFTWSDYDPEDETLVLTQMARAELVKQQVEEAKSALNLTEASLVDTQNRIKKGEELLKEKELVLVSNQERARTLYANIQQLTLSNWQQKSADQLHAYANELEQKNNALTGKLDALKKDLDQKIEEHNLANVLLEKLRTQLIDANKQKTQAQSNISRSIAELGLGTTAAAYALLALNLNVEQIFREYQAYRDNINHTSGRLSQLEASLREKPFDANAFATLEGKTQTLQASLDENQEQQAALTHQVEEAERDSTTRATLLQDLALKKQREELLKELAGLFRGKALIKYVGAQFLKGVVTTANERFRKLTRNQLELMIDDSSTDINFKVIDHLNGGSSRSAKTLSGGQTFQASLCMALALSELIGGGQQQFFFLDEGFGTQDNEALQDIITTLDGLRKAGQVVGLISHVDEMKQWLEASLHVTNTDKEGSKVLMRA